MTPRLVRIAFLASVILVAIPVLASDTVGTVQTGTSYVWGENIGWINLAPTNASNAYVGLVVTDSVVTGYAWSQTYGWINFSPVNGGVTNNGEGNLAGYAWVSGRGWLSLTGVTISDTGVFEGTATGSDTGRVSFSCSNCETVTDWRPVSIRGGATPEPPPTETDTETTNGSGVSRSRSGVPILTTSPNTTVPSSSASSSPAGSPRGGQKAPIPHLDPQRNPNGTPESALSKPPSSSTPSTPTGTASVTPEASNEGFVAWLKSIALAIIDFFHPLFSLFANLFSSKAI